MRSLWPVLTILLLVGGCTKAIPPNKETPAPGENKAPDFALTTIDGLAISLAQFKGKVVLIDVWATWCPPCRLSLPHIQSLAQDPQRQRQGLVVLAVNAGEAAGRVKSFLDKNQYTFTVPMDAENKMRDAYGITGYPTTIVVGRDGSVAAMFEGFDPNQTAKSVDEAIDAALRKK